MAAMLVDFPLAEASRPATPQRWVHVDSPRPGGTRPAAAPPARPQAPVRPGGRRQGVAAPRLNVRPASAAAGVVPRPAEARLRLTDRGLAVVVGGFALVMATALVVLVTAFLAVPNEPIAAQLLLG